MALKKTKKQAAFQERRKASRANHVVAVRHRLIQRGKKKYKPEWGLSTTKNMSISGVLFWSATPYKPGDILELEIVMSGMIDMYKGQAEVVRQTELSAASFDVAAKYTTPKPKPRSAKKHL